MHARIPFCHRRPTVPDLTIGTPESSMAAKLRSRPMNPLADLQVGWQPCGENQFFDAGPNELSPA